MSFEKISVIGLGYIGLPTAAMFASRKKQVLGVDSNPNVVDTVNLGKIHIIEPELDSMVHTAVEGGYLSAARMPEAADAFLIAVPTPFKSSESQIPEPDLSYIESAIQSIAPVLKKGDLVVLESTSPVGTTGMITEWLTNLRPDLVFPTEEAKECDVNVAHCPERVLPGQVVRELVENDRIIGGVSARCSERALKLYKIFVQGECVITNARTAEMAKLTENSCRDVEIAFANELSIICDNLKIDVWELISLANRHPRINILQPGPGVGGHCIAVDPWFIISKSPDQAKIMHTARKVNLYKEDWVVNKVKATLAEMSVTLDKPLSEVKVAYLGLAFKPNIDDLRESPALNIVNKLRQIGSEYICVEPNITFSNDHRLETLNYAIKNADLMVVLVKHDEFVDRKAEFFASDSVLLDFCGINN